ERAARSAVFGGSFFGSDLGHHTTFTSIARSCRGRSSPLPLWERVASTELARCEPGEGFLRTITPHPSDPRFTRIGHPRIKSGAGSLPQGERGPEFVAPHSGSTLAHAGFFCPRRGIRERAAQQAFADAEQRDPQKSRFRQVHPVAQRIALAQYRGE